MVEFIISSPPLCVQVTALIEELAAAGSDALGITLEAGTVPRLLAYARSVSGFPTAVKEVGVTFHASIW